VLCLLAEHPVGRWLDSPFQGIAVSAAEAFSVGHWWSSTVGSAF